MIVALEGAPGVGKSTTALALAGWGAALIAEVNQLFVRPEPEPEGWYLERQNERWEMAAGRARAVLDGDPFQPLWFNWTFGEEDWGGWQGPLEFYRRRVSEGRMGFPDRYVFLTATEPVREARMLRREIARGLGEERARQKTARYARLVEPQARFFRALEAQFPGWVAFVESVTVEGNVAAVRGLNAGEAPKGLAVLEFVEGWLGAERP